MGHRRLMTTAAARLRRKCNDRGWFLARDYFRDRRVMTRNVPRRRFGRRVVGNESAKRLGGGSNRPARGRQCEREVKRAPAAAVPVAIFSLAVWPGSRSERANQSSRDKPLRPLTSIRSTSRGA